MVFLFVCFFSMTNDHYKLRQTLHHLAQEPGMANALEYAAWTLTHGHRTSPPCARGSYVVALFWVMECGMRFSREWIWGENDQSGVWMVFLLIDFMMCFLDGGSMFFDTPQTDFSLH